MDCVEIKEMLDAYALGAAEADEADAIEEHVEECVRCWSSLNESQRLAATIALSTAFQRAPRSLRARILKETERAERPRLPSPLKLLRKLTPTAVGVLAAGAAASLAFAFFLQAEVNDLRDDKDQLEARLDRTGERLTDQQQVTAVLAASDAQRVTLAAADPASSAAAVYHWSGSSQTGALLCDNLPPLEEGQVYLLWFLTEDHSHPAASFHAWDGIGQVAVDLAAIPGDPIAVGVSIEDSADAREPGEMFLFAELGE